MPFFFSKFTFGFFCALGIGLILLSPVNNCSAQSPNLLDETVFTVVEKQPEFPGGMSALVSYLQKNVRYPEAARKANVTGRVFLSFIVERNGQLTDIQLLKGLGFGCDEEAMRVVQAMPGWKPGSQSGQMIRVKYNLPIAFGVPYPRYKGATGMVQELPPILLSHPPMFVSGIEYPIPMPPESTPSIPPVCTFGPVETPPEFPGGTKALMRYLTENTRYPEAAKQAGITGRVFASFVIDTAGYVSQAHILKELGYGCDEEAIRLLNGLPRWKPGTVAGRGVVAVKYNLPINFPPKQPDPLREN